VTRYGPWEDSASDRSENQGYFLGCKGGRSVELTFFKCRLSRNSRSKTVQL